MAIKTQDQRVAAIQEMEIAIANLEVEQGGKYGNLSPKIAKLIRKMQKLRNQL